MSTTRPTRRRWFRFSLRTVLIVVTMAAVALGLLWQKDQRSILQFRITGLEQRLKAQLKKAEREEAFLRDQIKTLESKLEKSTNQSP